MNKKILFKKLMPLIFSFVVAFWAFSHPIDVAAVNGAANDYWVFITTDDKSYDWMWSELGITITDYPNKFVYAKSPNSDQMLLLLGIETSWIIHVKNDVYCFTEDNHIYYINLSTPDEALLVYTSRHGDLRGSSYFFSPNTSQEKLEGICFIDGNYGVILDSTSNAVLYESECNSIESIFGCNGDSFYWVTENGTEYLRNCSSDIDISESRFMRIQDSIDKTSVDMYSSRIVQDINNFPLNSYSLGAYGNGAYFTTTGRACVKHNSCKRYTGATQCMGFAYYAYDRYAHVDSFVKINGDFSNKERPYTSGTTLKGILQHLPSSGIYLRLTLKGTTTDEGHSLFIESVGENSFSGYECNKYGDCRIEKFTYTYDDIVSLYSGYSYYVSETYSHQFNPKNAFADSPNSHRINCSSSGCPGYILEVHYVTPNSKAQNSLSNVCAVCGFEGRFPVIVN